MYIEIFKDANVHIYFKNMKLSYLNFVGLRILAGLEE